MPLSAGEKLGPYEILAPIGKGGMGEVWKARDTRLDRVVAIKQLKGQHSARFQQEARAIAALNHPHICQIYDVGPDYLVLEYVEGAPVQGPIAPPEAVRVALQIASALEAAHTKKILHRDLKPGNILMSAAGAKLLDFGLAKLVADEDVTQTVGVSGTPLYMSPEQAEGKPLDTRSDVFSFGAVLYELLAGRRAFDSLAAVLRDDPQSLGSVPVALQAIVTRCLRKNPAERFSSVVELRAALEVLTKLPAAQQPSIAVLPFANMSGDKEQEYFSDGLAEEIINVLAHIPGLRVIARTSAFAFKGQNTDIRQIAEALGVTHVLEGSVRKSGKRVRVAGQLITAHDGSHIWSERFDRDMEDVFAIQDEIAEAIAAALKMRLSPHAVARRHTPTLPAYEALLKARHYLLKWTPESLPRGKQCYQEAIELDPQFASAHSELGLHYFVLASENQITAREAAVLMREEARTALQIDPSLAEAHAVLALVAVLEYDWKEAGRQFDLAMAQDPVPPMVRYFYGSFYLCPLARLPEALQQFELALREDPLNPVLRMTPGLCLLGAGDAAGEAELLKVLELNENFWIPLLWLAAYYLMQGRIQEALAFAERGYLQVPSHRGVIGQFAGILKSAGNAKRAQELLATLSSGAAFGEPIGFFGYHMACREWELAAGWLEKAIEQRDTRAPWILPHLFGPGFTASPYWPKLAKMMNLP